MTYRRLDAQFYESEYERNARLRKKRMTKSKHLEGDEHIDLDKYDRDSDLFVAVRILKEKGYSLSEILAAYRHLIKKPYQYKVGEKVLVSGYGIGIIKLIEGNKYHIKSDNAFEFPNRVFSEKEFQRLE